MAILTTDLHAMPLYRLTCFLCIAVALSGRSFAQEREWSWDYTDTDAFLVFGTANTDDVGASFWCKLGSGQVRFTMPGLHVLKAGYETASISIEMQSTDLPGALEINADTGTTTFETTISLPSDLVTSLQDAAFFSVTVAGRKMSFPLGDSNFDALTKACRKP